MNAKKLIAAVAVFAAAGSALADNVDTTYPYVDHSQFVSTKARAEVVAELNQAVAKGGIARNNDFVDVTKVASGKTRAEVRAELEQAYAEGNYAHNSNQEFFEFTTVASTKTRDEVRNEAIQAAKGKQVKNGAIGG
ncbi:MAG: DUF4148 domain-containing protein [Noviherbaspirillum sp.]